MKQHFVKLSIIKGHATRVVEKFKANKNRTKKIIDSFMGKPATNKSWFNKASEYYRNAKFSQNWKKVNFLTTALLNIYQAEILMEDSAFKDHKVSELSKKIEMSYLNLIMKFLENSVYDIDDRKGKEPVIKACIEVLAERNLKMAKSYSNFLQESNEEEDSSKKLFELFDLPREEFTAKKLLKVVGFFQILSENIKNNPELKKRISEKVEEKLASLYAFYSTNLKKEIQKKHPSLEEIIRIISDFDNYYKSLKIYYKNEEYYQFSAKKHEFKDAISFLQKTYPDLKSLYHYLEFPRKKIDIKKISNLLEKLDEIQLEEFKKYEEFSKLDPSLDKIEHILREKLRKYLNIDLKSYYRHYNDFLNAEENLSKIREMVKFVDFLGQKITDNHDYKYLMRKLTSIKNNVEDELFESIEKKINEDLNDVSDRAEIPDTFDFAINIFLDLNKIEQVEHLQATKKSYMKRFKSNKKLNPVKVVKIKENLNIPQKLTKNSQLIIVDNYSLRNYVIFVKDEIKIGRATDNDIKIDCEWISYYHCILDFKNDKIFDLDSTNGVAVMDQKVNNEATLKNILHFSLANTFKFSLGKIQNNRIFKLDKILDRNFEDDKSELVNSLKNTNFIFLSRSNFLSLHKKTGNINTHFDDFDEVFKIEFKDNHFLISDSEKNIFNYTIQDTLDFLSDRFTFRVIL